MYKVQKKDGSLEDFDRNKIINVLLSSGASKEEAEKMASEIEAWLPKAAVNGVVKSTDIRAYGLGILEKLNPTAYSRFISYKKQG